MKVLKNIGGVFIALVIVAIIYTVPTLFITKWTCYKILFVYDTPVIRIISVILISLVTSFFVFRIKFKESDIHILNNKIVSFFIKLGFALMVITGVYLLSDYGMRTLFYKMAKDEFVYETNVENVGCFYKDSKIELSTIDNEEIVLQWSSSSLREVKNVMEKSKYNNIEILEECYNIRKGNVITISGRKNIFGIAIDKLELTEETG